MTLAQHVSDHNDPHGTLRLLGGYVTGGRFNPALCLVELLHGGDVVGSIDASPFVEGSVFEAADASGFPQAGEAGKLYVAKDENAVYRWDGSWYVQVGGPSVAVDPTLSVPGAAADAKATGDALAGKLSEEDAARGHTEWTFYGDNYEDVYLERDENTLLYAPFIAGRRIAEWKPPSADGTTLLWDVGERTDGGIDAVRFDRLCFPTTADLAGKADASAVYTKSETDAKLDAKLSVADARAGATGWTWTDQNGDVVTGLPDPVWSNGAWTWAKPAGYEDYALETGGHDYTADSDALYFRNADYGVYTLTASRLRIPTMADVAAKADRTETETALADRPFRSEMGYSAWTVLKVVDGINYGGQPTYSNGVWTYTGNGGEVCTATASEDAVSLGLTLVGHPSGPDYTAVRYRLPTTADLAAKADKAVPAAANDFAALNASGNLVDSGKKAADFATAAQGAKADAAVQPAALDAALDPKIDRSEVTGGFTRWETVSMPEGWALQSIEYASIMSGWYVVLVNPSTGATVTGTIPGSANDDNVSMGFDADESAGFPGGMVGFSRTRIPTMADIPAASSAAPQMDGTASAGSSAAYSRGDHVHPSDTAKLNSDVVAEAWADGIPYPQGAVVTYNGQVFTSKIEAPQNPPTDETEWDNITLNRIFVRESRLATVATTGSYSDLSGKPTLPAASSATPQMDGIASVGSSTDYARGDHAHPTDTSKLDAVAGAGAFSSSLTYVVGRYVTYNSRLYKCTVAVTTAGAWTGAANWMETTIGDVLWALNTASRNLGTLAPYPLIGALTPAPHPSADLYTPVDRAQQSITLTNGTTQFLLAMPTPTPILSLPWATYYAARDFVVDVDNSANGSDVDIDFADLGMAFDLAIPAGQTIADITTVAAGARARFYFSERGEVYESAVLSNIPCIALHRLDLAIINSNTQ